MAISHIYNRASEIVRHERVAGPMAAFAGSLTAAAAGGLNAGVCYAIGLGGGALFAIMQAQARQPS